VTLAAATGIAGLSIEDPTRDRAHPLHAFDWWSHALRLARHAIDESETGIALTGRSEGFVCGRPDIDETIRRLCAYADAGADCLYAPRIDTAEQVAAIVAAVSSKPVNVLIDALSVTVAAAALGVRRISVEGTLARTAWAGFRQHRRSQTQDRSPGSRCCPTLTPRSPKGSAARPVCVGHPRWGGQLRQLRRSRNRGCCPV
jgi:2-methylisocitrate lyase-like PEP mutase family enzyme